MLENRAGTFQNGLKSGTASRNNRGAAVEVDAIAGAAVEADAVGEQQLKWM